MSEPIETACRATVVANGTSTEYMVAGSGRTLVWLSGDQPESFFIFRKGFRVFAPTVPVEGTDADLTPWLDGFMDGLGLAGVVLVVEPALAGFGRAYADGAPSRVERVVVHQPDGH